MNPREAWEAAAALIVAIVVAAVVILSVKQSADQPMLPLVSAAGCEPVNPCLVQSCEPRKGPFGGVDMDAGERDQRRIA